MTTRGLGSSDLEMSGTSDDEIRRIVSTEVDATIRETILEMFGSIETAMIELFDERYVAITKAVVAATTAVGAAAGPHGVIWYYTRSSST